MSVIIFNENFHQDAFKLFFYEEFEFEFELKIKVSYTFL